MTKVIKKISIWMMAAVFAAGLGGALLTGASPVTASAAPDPCNKGFIGFPAWYRGLTDPANDCALKAPDQVGGLSNFIWRIGLNILEIALVAVAYMTAFYFIYGGFLFIVSRGKPDEAARARLTLLYAMVGLIISMAAVILVDFMVTEVLK